MANESEPPPMYKAVYWVEGAMPRRANSLTNVSLEAEHLQDWFDNSFLPRFESEGDRSGAKHDLYGDADFYTGRYVLPLNGFNEGTIVEVVTPIDLVIPRVSGTKIGRAFSRIEKAYNRPWNVPSIVFRNNASSKALVRDIIRFRLMPPKKYLGMKENKK